jgi:hypothetical protein
MYNARNFFMRVAARVDYGGMIARASVPVTPPRVMLYSGHMHMNYLAIVVASVAQFVVGAIWYTPVFGKLWGRIHGFEKKSPEEQKKMQREVGPLLGTQFVTTLVTTAVFALLLNGFPSEWNIYGLAGFFWLGFVVPTQISAVIFGGTEKKWFVTKIAVMAGASFLCLETAAFVLKTMA